MNQSVFKDIATEILETSTIIHAIKARGTIKKRPDELSIYHYVKRVNPSIDINVIINSLKNMNGMQKVENKPCNAKSSSCLIRFKNTLSDGMNFPNSQKY